mmetsp:Transcript_10909/g.20804  ORF Transcript_10909/g.20804 Transcript_10909/m.20804 type:complete len:200 (-) Transcript_10909:386-985(-)
MGYETRYDTGWPSEDVLELAKSGRPAVHPEAMDVAVGDRVLVSHVGRLIGTQQHLGIASSIQGSLVDVGAPDDGNRVVHDSHLRVNVDLMSPRLLQHLLGLVVGVWLMGRLRPQGSLPRCQAVEVKVVCRMGRNVLRAECAPLGSVPDSVAAVRQCLGYGLVHVLDGVSLPIEYLLNGSSLWYALGPHGQHNVGGEPLS